MRAQVLGSVGAYGTGAGQLNFPSGLALDAARGALYVTDCLNHRVVAYDAALRAPLLSFGRRGIADGDLSHPAGIALHDGDLFVADAGNARVSAFRRDGTFIRSFGGEGDAAGRFLMPQGIVSAHGRLYVSDHSGRRLQTFTARGEPLQQVNFVRNLVRGLDRDEMLLGRLEGLCVSRAEGLAAPERRLTKAAPPSSPGRQPTNRPATRSSTALPRPKVAGRPLRRSTTTGVAVATSASSSASCAPGRSSEERSNISPQTLRTRSRTRWHPCAARLNRSARSTIPNCAHNCSKSRATTCAGSTGW